MIFLNCLEIVRATLKDYRSLAEYHYRTEPIRPFTNIYKVRAKHPYTNDFPDPIAIIVYRMPIPDLLSRTKMTDNYFHRPQTKSTRLTLVNKYIRYIARLIVDPRFHRLGLATKLLTETLRLQEVPIIETLTPIDKTNSLFTKAGFDYCYSPAPARYQRIENAIRSIGLAPDIMLLPDTLQKRLDRLDAKQSAFMKKQINHFVGYFNHRAHMPTGPKRTKFLLSKLPYPRAYFIWHSPDVPLPPRTAEKSEKIPTIQ